MFQGRMYRGPALTDDDNEADHIWRNGEQLTFPSCESHCRDNSRCKVTESIETVGKEEVDNREDLNSKGRSDVHMLNANSARLYPEVPLE